MQALEDIPEYLADAWGITEATAQVMLCIVVLLAVILPVMLLTRNKKGVVIEAIFLYLTEAMLVGIGWLPFWILIGTVCMMAVVIAMFGAEIITGE